MVVVWAVGALALAAGTPAAPAPPPTVDPVAAKANRGWYLWRTGQDQAAAALATELVRAQPRSLAARELFAAMEVASGNGASLEVRTREWWGEDPEDPVRNVALAWAVTFRHAEAGPWCDEVAMLVQKVPAGDEHFPATLVDRERERRCTGDTDHADAELVRILRAGGAGADGVLAKIDAGYIKEDVPDALEAALAAEPWRVERVAALWRDDVAGPARGGARKVARQALDAAVISDDPVVVHAALLAFRTMAEERDAEAAVAQLRRLDPAADAALVRSAADLHDPEIYAKIAACGGQVGDASSQLSCLDRLTLPTSGAVAAQVAYQRVLLNQALDRPDAAFDAARAAHAAEPDLRFHARTFARMVEGRTGAAERATEGASDDLTAALAAMDGVLAGRITDGALAEGLPPRVVPQVASDLVLRGQLLRRAGRGDEALADLIAARRIGPTPVRQLLVGMALAEVGRTDEAGLELAWGLAVEQKDTATIALARDALAPIAAGWMGQATASAGLRAMLDAATRAVGHDATHAMVGQKVTDPALRPTPPAPPVDPAAKKPPKPVPPAAQVVVLWSATAPDSVEALSRVANLADKYAAKGVIAVALDIGPGATDEAWPAEVKLEHRVAGPAAMRAYRSVALPTVIVLDGGGTVVAGLSPYDRASLDLETALDAVIPATAP